MTALPHPRDMTQEQRDRFGAVVDSRVRLLGESFSRAYDSVLRDGGGNYHWIMTGEKE